VLPKQLVIDTEDLHHQGCFHRPIANVVIPVAELDFAFVVIDPVGVVHCLVPTVQEGFNILCCFFRWTVDRPEQRPISIRIKNLVRQLSPIREEFVSQIVQEAILIFIAHKLEDLPNVKFILSGEDRQGDPAQHVHITVNPLGAPSLPFTCQKVTAFPEDILLYWEVIRIGAVDQNTGKVKWKSNLGTMMFKSKIIAKSSRIYFGTIEGDVFSVNAETGNIIWKKHLEGGVWGSIAVGNSLVYVGCEDSNLYALDRNSGLKKWSVNLNSRIIAPVVISNRRIIALNYQGKAFGLKLDDGKIMWSKDFGVSKLTPIVSGSTVYLSVRDKIYGLKAGNGETIFTKSLSSGKSFITVFNKRVFVSNNNDTAFELSATGEIIWQHKLKSKIFGIPAANNKYLFVITDKGDVLKMRRQIKFKKNYKVKVLRVPGAIKNR
jgi:hypothetical protein